MVVQEESGLNFEFPDDSVYFPESEPGIAKLQAVKPCDAIYRDHYKGKPLINFIEIKSSSPNPGNLESKEDWNQYIKDMPKICK